MDRVTRSRKIITVPVIPMMIPPSIPATPIDRKSQGKRRLPGLYRIWRGVDRLGDSGAKVV